MHHPISLIRSGSVLAVLVALCIPTAWAQVDTSAWPQVRMEIRAVDQSGAPLSGISAEMLQIRGSGKPRPVAELTQDAGPQSVCILIDASNIDHLSLVKSKAKKLISRLPQEDEVCVAAYATDMTLMAEMTGDHRAAMNAVEAIQPVGGKQLRDALLAMAEYMRANSRNLSREVVVFSDMTDRNSPVNQQQVRQGLELAGTPVFDVVCLPRNFGHARAKQGDPAAPAAFSVTDLGGGMTYFPHTMADMNGLVEGLPETMRARYVLTYTAANAARDAHEEHIDVSFSPQFRIRQAHIQAPQGYYAPSQ